MIDNMTIIIALAMAGAFIAGLALGLEFGGI